jgi:hypothetical protein
MNIKDYIIINQQSNQYGDGEFYYNNFIEDISNHIKNGYKCLGAPFFRGRVLMQAMVKYED